MDAVGSFETSEYFFQIDRRNIPENSKAACRPVAK
jgi:hypothetical protein